MTFDHLHYQHEAPSLVRINGFGPALYGRFSDPAMAPVYYKQWVFTLLLVPVWFGRIYAVQSEGFGRGWLMHGWISGREFAARYGAWAYWRFRATQFALPVVMFLAFAALIAWIVATEGPIAPIQSVAAVATP